MHVFCGRGLCGARKQRLVYDWHSVWAPVLHHQGMQESGGVVAIAAIAVTVRVVFASWEACCEVQQSQ